MGRIEQHKWSNKTGKNEANVFETDAKVVINHVCGTINQHRKT